MRRSTARAAVAASVAMSLLGAPLFLANAAEVTPEGGSGNPGCADLLGEGDYAGEYKLEGDKGEVVEDGALGPVTIFDVTVNGEDEAVSFDFESTKPIVMVIVKGGTGSAYNVYDYRDLEPPYVWADPDGDPEDNEGDLTTSTGQGISHITFCALNDPLDVSVDAEGDYTTTTTWGLTKTVDGEDSTTRSGVAGDDAGEPVDWDVVLTRDDADGGYEMSGTALIENPNDHGVTADVSANYDHAPIDIDCDPVTGGNQTAITLEPAGDPGDAVSCTFTGGDGTTVEVDVDATSPGTPDGSAAADVDWNQSFAGAQSVDVDDDREDGTQFPAEDVPDDDSWTYDEQLTCPDDDGETYDENGVHEYTVVNTATAEGDGVDLSDSATVVVTCNLPETGLSVVKTGEGEDDVVNIGDTISYQMDVTATGDVTEADVVVSDYIPGRNPDVASGDTTYVAGSCAPTPCSYDDATGLVTWEVGDIASGATKTVSFDVTVDDPPGDTAPDDIVNVGAAESEQTPSTPSNTVVVPVTVVQPTVVTTTPPATVTPRTLPFADPETETPRVLPFTGTDWLLPALSLGMGFALVGALLIGAGRRRTQE